MLYVELFEYVKEFIGDCDSCMGLVKFSTTLNTELNSKKANKNIHTDLIGVSLVGLRIYKMASDANTRVNTKLV